MHKNLRKTIELDRSVGLEKGLGFSVVSEIGVKVKEILKDGAASVEGQLEVGDVILEVDGVKLDDSVSHNKAVRMLQESGQKVTLVVARKDRKQEDVSRKQEENKDEDWWEVVKIVLPGCKEDIGVRKLRPYGTNRHRVVVENIHEESEPFKDGRIKVGDVLLEMNDHWLPSWDDSEMNYLSKYVDTEKISYASMKNKNGQPDHLLIARPAMHEGYEKASAISAMVEREGNPETWLIYEKADWVPYSALTSRQHFDRYMGAQIAKPKAKDTSHGLKEISTPTTPPLSTTGEPLDDILTRLSDASQKEIKESIAKLTKKLEKQQEESARTQSVIDTLNQRLARFARDLAREEFECPVCFMVMEPPTHIWQCGSGHALCGKCRINPSIVSCPTCRNPISGRNVAMERIASALF